MRRVPIIVGMHDRNVGGRLAPAGHDDDWQSGAQVDAAAADSDLEGASGGSGAGAAGAPPGPGGNSGRYPTISYCIQYLLVYPGVPNSRIPPSDNPLI